LWITVFDPVGYHGAIQYAHTGHLNGVGRYILLVKYRLSKLMYISSLSQRITVVFDFFSLSSISITLTVKKLGSKLKFSAVSSVGITYLILLQSAALPEVTLYG
jgi:hypothetical protein